jgi:hypothetical protein
MIDEVEAAKRIESFLKCPSNDADRPWTMEPFTEGWLIRQGPLEGFYGQPSYVVERATGRIVSFPSGVPRRRIREEYEKVLPRATEEKAGE